jgi:hypothetical protein
MRFIKIIAELNLIQNTLIPAKEYITTSPDDKTYSSSLPALDTGREVCL